jgi:hypothetical protein
VWLAYGPQGVPGDLRDSGSLLRLFANAFAWAAGEPTAELLARRAPEPVALALERTGPHRVHLNVTNHGDEPARQRVVRLYPNRPVGEVRASATVLFRGEPSVSVRGEYVDLLLPDLGPASSRDYAIDLLPPQAR